MCFYCTTGFIKWLCSLLVCAMWPISGTFFRCSRELCSQVSSRINESLYCFRRSRLRKGPQRGLLTAWVIEGKIPEKNIWTWNKSHQKKPDVVRFYVFTARNLSGQEHKTHYLALSITKLYSGSCLSIYFCQEKKKKRAQIYYVLLSSCIFRLYVRIWMHVWNFIILFLLHETVKRVRCVHRKLLMSSC